MTKRHRRHSTAKKREVVEACLNGEALQALSRRHDVCRSLIRIWIEKYERGSNDDDAVEADLPVRVQGTHRGPGAAGWPPGIGDRVSKGARVRGQSQRDGSGSVITGPIASRSDAGAAS